MFDSGWLESIKNSETPLALVRVKPTKKGKRAKMSGLDTIWVIAPFIFTWSASVIAACGPAKPPSAADSRESSSISSTLLDEMRAAASSVVRPTDCAILIEAPYTLDVAAGQQTAETKTVNITIHNPAQCQDKQFQVRRTDSANTLWVVTDGSHAITQQDHQIQLDSSQQSMKLRLNFTADQNRASSDDLVLAFGVSGAQQFNSDSIRICGTGSCDKERSCSDMIVARTTANDSRFICALTM